MKTIIAFVLCVFAVASVYADEKYTSRFDNVDIDRILNNDRLLDNYVKCLLKDKSCTPDGNELKRLLPDALATECAKCTEKQKAGSEKVIDHLSKKRPELWKEILEKYDKDHVYRNKYAAEAEKRGIAV